MSQTSSDIYNSVCRHYMIISTFPVVYNVKHGICGAVTSNYTIVVNQQGIVYKCCYCLYKQLFTVLSLFTISRYCSEYPGHKIMIK